MPGQSISNHENSMKIRIFLPLLLMGGVVQASLIPALPNRKAASIGTLETYTSSVSAVIPDNDANGIVQTIIVPEYILSLSQVTVDLSTSGGWNGDLYAYLWHDNVISLLVNRPGRNSSNLAGHSGAGMTLFLDDHAALDLHLASSPLDGAFQPDARNVDPLNSLDSSPRTAPLSVFNGLAGGGEWRLYFADVAGGGTATLQGWSLHLVGSAVPEPSTLALLCLATALLLGRMR